MSYRDALRSAEEVDRISKGTRVGAQLGVVVAHIGGRVQSIREKGAGPLLEKSLEEIETLCRALIGAEDPEA